MNCPSCGFQSNSSSGGQTFWPCGLVIGYDGVASEPCRFSPKRQAPKPFSVEELRLIMEGTDPK